ncbi:oligopeptide/dipeptide ABC transporter, ATP-binding protein, C-terminal domain-containing protein [Monaibacterium marinum]|uniref:Oligopeptide/dipeptide ABC transporter, ATP-binding protein, C-terminal domain-containing protein n=1 Tax=Pontivivens marinum TaxID=1690039 RepID=A0A2C9CT12_9RHOB|nr:ABC transporter ATP-binding protein [Monaibacterium marinum]SOH94305.1 oligopeptide/dipeptide ABC transporter, ATP-binding protein, C-terminal domain-containing protein [Monaibacterium marinum]
MLLSVKDLKIQYKTRTGIVHAVDGISFDVPEGKVVGIVGESGCGKTTAVRSLLRVMPPVASYAGGEIKFDGSDILKLSEREMNDLRWRDIAYIPQSAMNALDPVWRVGNQIIEVLTKRGGMKKAAAKLRAEELFAMVGLEKKRLRDYPHQFSGGMRQRASIALALALSPRLAIADEPVTALDVIIQRQVLDTFSRLQREFGLSVVLVTHDISVVAYVCDYVVVMYAGKIVEKGPVKDVLTSPSHAYTIGLYNAFPELSADEERELSPIEGGPPLLLNPPEGCRFRERCPFAQEICKQEPVEVQVGPEHFSLCHRAHEAAEMREQARDPAVWRGVVTA